MKATSKSAALFSVLIAILFNCLTGGLIAYGIGIAPVIGAISMNVISIAMPLMGMNMPSLALFSGLNKEIWIDRLLTEFIPKNDFLQDGEDWSDVVDNDRVNFAELGQAPGVEINRTSYPIPVAAQGEGALWVEFDEYSSDQVRIQDYQAAEVAYPILDARQAQAKRALQTKYGDKAFHNIAVTANTSDTPVIQSTGADNGSGMKLITKTDIASLGKAWDNLNYPSNGRVLAFSPNHFWEFVDSDETLKRQYELNAAQGVVTGVLLSYYGFKIRMRTGSPLYRLVSGVWTKQAFGATKTSNDHYAAVAYIEKQSFMHAEGTVKMYDLVDDPAFQATTFSYRMRALAAPFRQKMLGAIVQVPV
ncbi:hypothetical protein BH09BAC1_BH09BAC1_04920 [soil metagenome]